MAFYNLYFHSLDSKNRIFIPAKYREELGEKFFVIPGPDHNLFLYPEANFEEIAEQYRETHRDIKQQTNFFSRVADGTIDNQGRMTVDAKHLKYVQFKKETAIVGAGRRIEIWPIERFKLDYNEEENPIDFSPDINW